MNKKKLEQIRLETILNSYLKLITNRFARVSKKRNKIQKSNCVKPKSKGPKTSDIEAKYFSLNTDL